MESKVFLLQMAGTSGAGKSTLARLIGEWTGAVVIDYDVLKSAALDAGATWDLAGRTGYRTGQAIAGSVLQQGMSVILDSPSRFQQIVDTGLATAAAHDATYAFVECVLPDETELRRRLQGRQRQRSQRMAFDIPPPDAPNDVMADASGIVRVPESKFPSSPWLKIDTRQSPARCLALVLEYLDGLCSANDGQTSHELGLGSLLTAREEF